MIEVTKADNDGDITEEYNYDQEEFDDYEDEDFDSVSSSSSSHSFKSPPAPSESDRLDLMQVCIKYCAFLDKSVKVSYPLVFYYLITVP